MSCQGYKKAIRLTLLNTPALECRCLFRIFMREQGVNCKRPLEYEREKPRQTERQIQCNQYMIGVVGPRLKTATLYMRA